MDKPTTPLIEGIDSQTMQGGSYIRQPDGSVARVEGVNLTKEEKKAAPAIIQAHNEAMAVAAAQAEAAAANAAKEGAEGSNAEGAQATAAPGTSSASSSSEQPAAEDPASRRRNKGE